MATANFRLRRQPWKTSWVVAAGFALCGLLIMAGLRWPQLFTFPGLSQYFYPEVSPDGAEQQYPFVELLKLISAGLLGLILTAVHRHTRHEKPLTSSLEHAQILLCISGAIIMIIIGNSLARAFGIAGGAAIVRFRTPVEDPKDAMVLFLLLGIGMACGLAAFGVAILGTLFLAVVLLVLDRMADPTSRELTLELVSIGPAFPSEHVRRVFSESTLDFEQREVIQGDPTTIRYMVKVDPATSLETLIAELMNSEPPALRAVSWVKPKKSA